MMTGLFAFPFSPFAKTAKKAFNLNLNEINLAASLYLIAAMLAGIPANYFIFKIGIRKSMIFTCGFFFAGNGLKLLTTLGVYFVHFGQFVSGLGVPFITNCTAKFAGHWYTEGNSVSL
jgi:MFS family permease